MAYEECLLARRLLDRDKRFTGTVFSRRKRRADDYSGHLQLKNDQEFGFSALNDFRRWHARFQINRQASQRTRQYLAHLCL
jgi:hypothetical protein